jgi:hypothetical protein
MFIKNFIKSFIKKIMPKELPKPLGRWNIDYCNTKMNQKIDLSNEDHCGPCGQYAITKTKALQNVKNMHDDIKNDVNTKL